MGSEMCIRDSDNGLKSLEGVSESWEVFVEGAVFDALQSIIPLFLQRLKKIGEDPLISESLGLIEEKGEVAESLCSALIEGLFKRAGPGEVLIELAFFCAEDHGAVGAVPEESVRDAGLETGEPIFGKTKASNLLREALNLLEKSREMLDGDFGDLLREGKHVFTSELGKTLGGSLADVGGNILGVREDDKAVERVIVLECAKALIADDTDVGPVDADLNILLVEERGGEVAGGIFGPAVGRAREFVEESFAIGIGVAGEEVLNLDQGWVLKVDFSSAPLNGDDAERVDCGGDLRQVLDAEELFGSVARNVFGGVLEFVEDGRSGAP